MAARTLLVVEVCWTQKINTRLVILSTKRYTDGDQNSMAEEQTLDQWAQNWELDDTTRQTLVDNGFVSMKSVKLLTPSLIQKHFKGVSVAQLLLLHEAISALSPGSGKDNQSVKPIVIPDPSQASGSGVTAQGSVSTEVPPRQAPTGEDLSDMWRLLTTTGGSTNDRAPQASAMDGKPLTFDPFNCPPTSDNVSFRDIRDFVTQLPEQKKKNTFKMGDVELSIPDSKPKLENITPLQYMEASLRIAREMVQKDGADLQKVLAYMGYLIKVATMDQRFSWHSTLKYDQE